MARQVIAWTKVLYKSLVTGALHPSRDFSPTAHPIPTSASMGGNNTAENFATKARPNVTALKAAHANPGRSKCRHQAPTEARKKNVITTSEVVSAPCARKAGLNTNNNSDRK